MSRSLKTLVLVASLCTAGNALACGEGIFRMGGGLRYQGYLAPTPAEILVYDTSRAPPRERALVYRGLVRAGHRLTIAHDDAELARALEMQRYDVVIAARAEVEQAAAAAAPADAAAPKWLRVVADVAAVAQAGAAQGDALVAADAGVGRYLRLVDRLVGR